MAFVTYKDYKALYGEGRLEKAGFARLSWEAERIMDDATTGVDGVRKLRRAYPLDEYGAEAVKRCACALVDVLWQLEAATETLRKAQAVTEDADGSMHSRLVASRSAGSESISYATGSAAKTGSTAIDAAVSDQTARARYLSGIPDANGVNLLFMGRYPVTLGEA